MISYRHLGPALAAIALYALAFPAHGQLPVPERPHAPFLYRSYQGTTVPPVYAGNSQRLYELVRSGILYLSLRDAIALAIENNIDLAIARYEVPAADWAVTRARAGGPLRFAGSTGAPQVNATDPGVGALGALQAGGLTGGTGNVSSVGGTGSGGATVQQVGPVVVNFDPTFTNTTTFSHVTTPFTNLSVTGTSALVDSNRVYTTQIQEGLPTGGSVNIRDYEFNQHENSPYDILNPVEAPYLRAFFQQPLLQGFGLAFNNHYIRVAQIGALAAKESFRGRLLGLVANVENLYWSLYRANEELKIRRRAVEIAERDVSDTKKEIGAGALPAFELSRVEGEAASRRQDLILANAGVMQQQASMMQQIFRGFDPAVENLAVVPTDTIEVPAQDELPPLAELVSTAMKNRPDVAVSKFNDESAAINTIGTTNGLLPTLIAYGGTYNRGTAGTAQPSSGVTAPAFATGGYGTALGQVFRRDFPTEYAGVSLQSLPIHNRQAQADYGIEQLQLQASQITGQKQNNDIAVAVSNQMIALRQARSRYTVAVNTRQLQQQLLTYEQEKFTYGTSTFNNIIADQRAVVAAQISELDSLTAYAQARVGLNQVLGKTLDQYDITLDEGLNGQVPWKSKPAEVSK
jgi:outer membrane protein TolC